jgi:hypothetical protein
MDSDQESAAAPSPTLARRMLVANLQQLHKKHGLSTDRIGHHMGVGGSTVARWIGGQKMNLRPHDVRALMAAWGYGPEDDITVQLVQLAQDAKRRRIFQRTDWFTANRFDLYIELEADAVGIDTYEPTLVPGLLQTKGYAKAVIGDAIPEEEGVEERLALRLKRQEILTREERPARLDAIIDESVLRRMPPDRAVGREQLAHLIEIGQLPNVSIKVLPYVSGPHSTGTIGSFVVLEFAQVERVAYQEAPGSATYLDTAEETAEYLRVIERLAERALDPDRSAAMISAVLNNH